MKKRLILAFLLFAGLCWAAEKQVTLPAENIVEAFTRASVAYEAGLSIENNIARTRSCWIVSESDGAFVLGQGAASENVHPQCSVGSVIYGAGATTGHTYKSTDDGVNWTRTQNSTSVGYIWALPSGTLIGSNGANAAYRSTDGGENWTQITLPGGFSASAALYGWGLDVGKGTVLLAEYRGVASAFASKYVWRSTDDGATWTVALNLKDLYEEDPPTGLEPYHIHTVAYHSATGRWIVSLGDNWLHRRILVSADDGIAWSELCGLGKLPGQPVCFYDYGHPTKLLGGDDAVLGVFRLDVVSGEYEILYDNTDSRAQGKYVFAIGKAGGVYYAMLSSTNGDRDQRALLASADGQSWVPYHNFDEDFTASIRPPVYVGGKVHWSVFYEAEGVASYRQFSVSPARFVKAKGTLVTPGSTNLLNENNSSVETSIGNWLEVANDWDMARVDTDAYHGSYSVKAYGFADTDKTNKWNRIAQVVSLEAGRTYIASVMAKGGPATINLQFYDSSTPRGTAVLHCISPHAWRRFYSYPLTVPEGGYSTTIYLYTEVYGDPVDIYFDAAEIYEAPYSAWMLGGAAQAAEALTQTVTVGKVWTDVFAISLPIFYEYYKSATPLVIKTWALDSDNKVVLAYDSAESKFNLTRTIGGSAEETVKSSEPIFWQGDSSCIFTLRISATETQLTYVLAGAKETLTDGGMAALTEDEIVGTYGTFPMIVLNEWKIAGVYPVWLPDADLGDVLKLKASNSLQPPLTGGGAGAELLGGGSLLGN